MKGSIVLTGLGLLVAMAGAAGQQAIPDFSGSWRCEPEPRTCDWSGQSFTVKQSGAVLTTTNERGEVAEAKVTSPISLSMGGPWNMLGTVLPDQKTIEWSNGTRWRRQ